MGELENIRGIRVLKTRGLCHSESNSIGTRIQLGVAALTTVSATADDEEEPRISAVDQLV